MDWPLCQLLWPQDSVKYQTIAQITFSTVSFHVLWEHFRTPLQEESKDVQYALQVGKTKFTASSGYTNGGTVLNARPLIT